MLLTKYYVSYGNNKIFLSNIENNLEYQNVAGIFQKIYKSIVFVKYAKLTALFWSIFPIALIYPIQIIKSVYRLTNQIDHNNLRLRKEDIILIEI